MSATLPKARVLSEGVYRDHTPTSAVTAGTPIQVEGLCGIPACDMVANVKGAACVQGVATCRATADVGKIGDPLFWDADGDPYDGTAGTGAATTNPSDGDFFMGCLTQAKGASDKYAFFALNEVASQAAKTLMLDPALLHDPTIVHRFFTHFDAPWDTNQWDINTVEAGSGSASEAVGDEAGGVLTLTNDDADDDADQVIYKTESFKLAAGKRLYAEFRVKASEATQIDIALGLIASEDLTAVADNLPADGVVWKSDDGDTHLDFCSSKDGTDEKNEEEGTLDTDWHVFAFYFDGAGTITPYLDGVAGTPIETTICDDEELAAMLLVRNGSAAARTLKACSIDVRQLL